MEPKAATGRTGQRGNTLARRLDPRANSLNFLRLLLATAVIVSHAWPLGGFGAEPHLAGRSPGGYAVYAFFALSGYLIMGSRLNSTFGDFLRRRVLRLYPAFLVCLLVTVFLVAPLGYLRVNGTLAGYASTPTTPLDFLAASVDLRVNGTHVAQTPVNGHGWAVTLWTLYYEFLCYLVVGLLAFWGAFRRSSVVAVVMLAGLSVVQFNMSVVAHYVTNKDLLHMIDLLPYFLAGAIAYQQRHRLVCTWWSAAAAVAVVVAVPVLLGDRFVVLIAFPLAVVLLHLGAVLRVRVGRRNDVSYGIYLYSGLVQQLLFAFGVAEAGFAVYVVLSVALTVPFAVASWFLVERPAMRLGRGRRPADRPSGAVHTAPPAPRPGADARSGHAEGAPRLLVTTGAGPG